MNLMLIRMFLYYITADLIIWTITHNTFGNLQLHNIIKNLMDITYAMQNAFLKKMYSVLIKK